jgi:hypothetical protein
MELEGLLDQDLVHFMIPKIDLRTSKDKEDILIIKSCNQNGLLAYKKPLMTHVEW